MSRETWFEVKIDHDLAILLQRIVNIYNRIGKARREQFLARVSSALPEAPQEGDMP